MRKILLKLPEIVPMANAYPIDLCGLEGEYYQTYADHFAIYLPDRAAWERMVLDEKLRIEHRLRHCQEIVGEGKRLYGVDLSPLLPQHLMDENDLPLCDVADLDRVSLEAVDAFFHRDVERLIPYARATIFRRKRYLRAFYTAFSVLTGNNPPLLFETLDENHRGSYRYEDNQLVVNTLLLVSSDPHTVMRTILHEARHAFQYYAVSHPWRVVLDKGLLYEWESNISYYFRAGEGFNVYKYQPIEADADRFARRGALRE